MWVKILVVVAVVAGVCSSSGAAQASGADFVFPEEAAYVLIGVPVGSNLTFTAIDLAYAARATRTPRGAAIAETACSGAQLVLLTMIGAALAEHSDRVSGEAAGFFIGYYAWTAALTTHGIVTLATQPSRQKQRASAPRWDVGVTPGPRARGGSVTLSGIW
jgi:hypothetical protein